MNSPINGGGDMVTCFGWQNVWLNEGFATYCDVLYLERHKGHQAFINTMLSRLSSHFGAEAVNPHPIYNPPPNLIFSWGHSYCKGSWVLHMIRYLWGSNSLWLRLFATYRNSFAYKNASTRDLNRIMNRVLNGNYDWFFNEYVYDMGYPYYNVVWNKVSEPPNWRLLLDVSQIQSIGPPVFHIPLPLGINFTSGDTIIILPINQSPQHFEFLLPQEPLSIVVDPEHWVIQKNVVTGINEQKENAFSPFSDKPTVARRITFAFKQPKDIELYNILGRQVFKGRIKNLVFKPEGAGVYFIKVEGMQKKIVIIK